MAWCRKEEADIQSMKEDRRHQKPKFHPERA
jgi:hypothetical protein